MTMSYASYVHDIAAGSRMCQERTDAGGKTPSLRLLSARGAVRAHRPAAAPAAR